MKKKKKKDTLLLLQRVHARADHMSNAFRYRACTLGFQETGSCTDRGQGRMSALCCIHTQKDTANAARKSTERMDSVRERSMEL